jgi:hypothetical protein
MCNPQPGFLCTGFSEQLCPEHYFSKNSEFGSKKGGLGNEIEPQPSSSTQEGQLFLVLLSLCTVCRAWLLVGRRAPRGVLLLLIFRNTPRALLLTGLRFRRSIAGSLSRSAYARRSGLRRRSLWSTSRRPRLLLRIRRVNSFF